MSRSCTRYAFLAVIGIFGPMASAEDAPAAIIERGPATTIRQGYVPDVIPECNIRLKGEIIEGDFERLAGAMARVGRADWEQLDLCLDSPGGSFQEALKIIEYLTRGRGKGTATTIEPGAKCLSACALIFMAGNLQGEHGLYPLRRLHVRGTLGFHAPFLSGDSRSNKTYSEDTVINSYRAGIVATQQIVALLGAKGAVEGAYQNAPWMKPSLIQALLLQGPGEMLYIDTVDKAGRWNIRVFGHPASTAVGGEAAAIACLNSFGWEKDEDSYFSRRAEYGIRELESILDQGSRRIKLQIGDGDVCEVRVDKNTLRFLSLEVRNHSDQLSWPVVDLKPGLSFKEIAGSRPRESEPRGKPTERTVEYRIASNVSLGVLRMRNGPGVRHEIVTEIPAGSVGVHVAERSCRAADDGRSRYRWCRAIWQGHSGWVSIGGLVK